MRVMSHQVLSYFCFCFFQKNVSPTLIEDFITKQFSGQDFGDVLHRRFGSFPFRSVQCQLIFSTAIQSKYNKRVVFFFLLC